MVCRRPHPDAAGLIDLVDDVEGFLSDVVARRPTLSAPRPRRDPTRLADPDALWRDLLGRGTRRPAFRLVREGATAPAGAVSRPARIGNRDLADVIDPNRVIEGYRAGSTVVLQGLHLTDPGLARLATNLALELDQPVQVNAYLSPASARGLEVHFDFHDVLVVQLEGSKRWEVWAPTESTREPINGRHAPARPTRSELGEPMLDLVLEPGDVLHLPRGHPHVAATTDQASAHLTLGLTALTWLRLARRAVEDAVADGPLRRSLPPRALEPDPTTTDRPGSRLGGSVAEERLSLDVRSLASRRWMAQEIWRRQAPTRLRPRHPVDPAAVDQPLDITPGPLLALSCADGRAHLFAGDRTISMPDEAHPFLAALLRADGPVRRTDLPGLDDASSRVVIARLLDEGILASAPPSRHG